MATTLSNFYRATTKSFQVTVKVETVLQDITADVMTLTIKAAKGDADPEVLQVNADVATSGASGIALFDLTPIETDITPGAYYYDIVWYPVGSDEHLVEGQVVVIERVSD